MDIDNLFNLDGKVAVITGGGDGIGKGCAQILASAGASVIVRDINQQKALTPELEEKMLRHTPIKCLGEVSDIARAVLFFGISGFLLDKRTDIVREWRWRPNP